MSNQHPFIPLHSRSHPLYNFSSSPAKCFIKREDELSCGISGSKSRKYASLLPFLNKNNIKHVIIIGSTHSNNILAAAQLLKEHQIKITALLLKPHSPLTTGNFKLSQLFLKENQIHWIERDNWPDVENYAYQLAAKQTEACYVLPEGAATKEATTGANTLGQDIIKNEQQLNLKFQHIFIDAGTGFSASCCIQYLESIQHPAQIYVVLLADTEAQFKEKAQQWTGAKLSQVTYINPTTAKSFGSVNKTIKQYIANFAYQHGILLDPIYSAKLFYESQKYLSQHSLQGNVLCIHSGGILTLPYFDL